MSNKLENEFRQHHVKIQPPCAAYYNGRLWQEREFDAWSEADRQFAFRSDHEVYDQPARRGQDPSPTSKESHRQPESKVVSNYQNNYKRNRC